MNDGKVIHAWKPSTLRSSDMVGGGKVSLGQLLNDSDSIGRMHVIDKSPIRTPLTPESNNDTVWLGHAPVWLERATQTAAMKYIDVPTLSRLAQALTHEVFIQIHSVQPSYPARARNAPSIPVSRRTHVRTSNATRSSSNLSNTPTKTKYQTHPPFPHGSPSTARQR